MNNKIPVWEVKTDGKKEIELVTQVLKSNFPNDGEVTKKFEDKLAKLLEVKYIVTVTSATMAIFASLKALNITPDDEVIVPDVTFLATANAVNLSGAKPVLVDIDPKTMNMDPLAFKKAITKKTKAVIPVHVSGRHADMSNILKIAKKHKIFVVEDAAEAFMSKYQGKYLGTFGDLGCFSLSPNKTITSGQGGIVATNNKKLYLRLLEIKDQGSRVRAQAGFSFIKRIGYNLKFTNLQAALGLAQLTSLRPRMKRLTRNYELYKKYLIDIPQVTIFDFDVAKGELPLWTDIIAEKRDALAVYLEAHEIGSRRYWNTLHSEKTFKRPEKEFPNSTRMTKKTMWLASAYTLKDTDIKKVCSTIKDFYQKPQKIK